jgi:hypothetical protein
MAVPALRDFFALEIPTRMLIESLAIGGLAAAAVGVTWGVAQRRTARS